MKRVMVSLLMMICMVLLVGCEPGTGEGELNDDIVDEVTVEREEVYMDAVKIRNAAALYCAQTQTGCDPGDELTYTMLEEFFDTLDVTKYDIAQTNDVISIIYSGGYYTTLERAGTGEYEFPFDLDPVNHDYTATVIDTN